MGIDVKYAVVTTQAESIRGTANNIGKELINLEKRVKAELDRWQGEASESYQRKQGQWKTNTEGLVSTLRSLANQLEDSVSGYQSTDRRSAAKFDV